MQMKKLITVCACVFFLVFGTVALYAETEKAEARKAPAKNTKEKDAAEPTGAGQQDTSVLDHLAPAHFKGGYFGIGGVYNNLDGAMEKVSEFQPAIQGARPNGRFGAWGYKDGFAWGLDGRWNQGASDQEYNLGIDVNRIWKSEFRLIRFPRRLINDPLTNLDAAKGGPMVQHDSHDVGIKYCPVYQDLEWINRIQAGSMVTLHVDYRRQSRKGAYQGRTMSKCSSCHVESYSVPMDREVNEFRTGAEVGNATAKVEYEFRYRDSKDNAEQALHTYDIVRHPTKLSRVFTDRAQFEEADGPLPFNHIPQFKKTSHLVRGRFRLPNDAGELIGTYIHSRNTNEDVNYETKTNVISGRYGARVGDKFRLAVKVRNLDIDTDSYFVDVNERVADGGPFVGKTYPEAYPEIGELDYTAHSHLARENFDFTVDGRVLVLPKSVIRFGYEYDSLKRPYFTVRESKTHTLKAGFNSRPNRNFRTRAQYSYSTTDTPFTHIGAAIAPVLDTTATGSPFSGLQYFEIYDAREVNLSNFPGNHHEFLGNATFSPTDTFSITAHFRYDYQNNDDLNTYGNWKDSRMAPSVDIWFAPSEKVDFLANYAYGRRKTESVFGIAVYDG